MADTSVAQELRKALGDAFSGLDCRRALAVSDGDLHKAAEWLTSGAWLTGKLINWNVSSLMVKALNLARETQHSDTACLAMLKNCAGNEELAKRKLAGLPALP